MLLTLWFSISSTAYDIVHNTQQQHRRHTVRLFARCRTLKGAMVWLCHSVIVMSQWIFKWGLSRIPCLPSLIYGNKGLGSFFVPIDIITETIMIHLFISDLFYGLWIWIHWMKLQSLNRLYFPYLYRCYGEWVDCFGCMRARTDIDTSMMEGRPRLVLQCLFTNW